LITKTRATFQAERAQDCFQEAMPLLQAHWQEIAHFKDIPLDPHFEAYKAFEDLGLIRCYTSRIGKELVGYAVYFVRKNMHYQNSVQALQDILFILPEHRGFGARFILWCDQQLKAEGVQAVYHHVKAEHNFGPMLERLGYELVDLIYAKRMDI